MHLPPAASLAAALLTEAALREKGVDDVLVIRRGDMRHAVSLGLDSHDSSMRRRVDELRKHGIEPAVVKCPGGGELEWLEVQFRAEQTFPAAEFGASFEAMRSILIPCH